MRREIFRDAVKTEIMSVEDRGEETSPLTVKDFAKDDTVYILQSNFGCCYRGTPVPPKISVEKVVSVGRKYLQTANGRKFQESGERYLNESVNFGIALLLFKTEAELHEYLEKQELSVWLGKISVDQANTYSLEQLRQVKKLLEQ